MLFFKAFHILDARSLARNLRIAPLQRHINIGVCQQTLQALNPLLEPFQLVYLFWCLHSYYLSSGSIAIPAHPTLNRSRSSYPILAPHGRKTQELPLHLAHNLNFKGFTISNRRLNYSICLHIECQSIPGPDPILEVWMLVVGCSWGRAVPTPP